MDMANLYKCDRCEHIGGTVERMTVRLIPPGKTWKDAKNLDLCPECTQTYLKSALVLLN